MNDFEVLIGAIEQELTRERRTEFAIGQRELSAHGARERVVWVPLGGVLSKASTGAITRAGTRIQPLYDNRLTVVAHLRAGSMGELLALWADVLTASQKVLGPACAPGAYEFETEQERAGFVHGKAASMSQAFTWSLFVSRYGPVEVAPGVYGERTAVLTKMDLSGLLRSS